MKTLSRRPALQNAQTTCQSLVQRVMVLGAFIFSMGAPALAVAQPPSEANPLIGTWKLLSVDNVNPDGTRVPRHGAHPAGLLIFDAQGHYSLIVLTEGTPEEYKAALEGNNADYGRYTVDSNRHAITFYMDHASHPELEGSSHTRYFTIVGDCLTYTTIDLLSSSGEKNSYGKVVLERVQ